MKIFSCDVLTLKCVHLIHIHTMSSPSLTSGNVPIISDFEHLEYLEFAQVDLYLLNSGPRILFLTSEQPLVASVF